MTGTTMETCPGAAGDRALACARQLAETLQEQRAGVSSSPTAGGTLGLVCQAPGRPKPPLSQGWRKSEAPKGRTGWGGGEGGVLRLYREALACRLRVGRKGMKTRW